MNADVQSYPNKDGMRAQLLAHLHDINRVADVAMATEDPKETIDLVVVTDAEAILGIGDQGVGGITISTSKSALYTLGAGINPNRILPVMLDVGTNNHSLFSDPLYMGWKRTRLRGKVYDDFVDQFVQTCREIFPKAVIHVRAQMRKELTFSLRTSAWRTRTASCRSTRTRCPSLTTTSRGRAR